MTLVSYSRDDSNGYCHLPFRAGIGILKNLRSLLDGLEQSGLLPVLMVTVCIQGTVILGQFLVALILSPSELGVIRSLESALSVLVLVGSAGTQALSIRDIAEEQNPRRRMIALRNIYLVVITGALIVGLTVVGARALMRPSAIVDAVALCAGMVLLTNMLRATTGFAQGAALVQHCYRRLMVLSGVSIVLQISLAGARGIPGWIAARYLGEAVTLIGLLIVLRRATPPVPWRAPLEWVELMRSVRHGSAVNLALVLRLLADSLPVLALTAFKVPTDRIGVFGLAMLALTSVTLPLAVLVQRALPKMVSALSRKGAMEAQMSELVRMTLLTGVVGAAALCAVSMIAYWLIGGAYSSAFLFAAVLSWILPIKALALAYGTRLMVVRRYGASVWINLAEVALGGGVCFLGIPAWGAQGAAVAVALGTVWSAAALCAVSCRMKRWSL
ncbi:MAG: hypothetical protein ROZ37_14000 [Aromatoleum sp.]|jgi:O-antigen/teichoic acid export membrane protein|uniref:lipopolysaccharide biosynthesis protein n=1 Tax=Aromatoleum sp. TaxID=2307007 RepID=UPI002893EBBF|nr:hypothetical protein [Aromatoleum sp.]MDT3671428.1 hypothetical protein [Aromatoleum sp.]